MTEHRHEYEPASVVVSMPVLLGLEPIRMVGHHDLGHWSATCGTVTDVEDIKTMPLSWLAERQDVGGFVKTLAVGRMVVRQELGEPWVEEAADD